MDATAVNAGLFTALGWFLGFLSRYLEARWKAAESLQGALRACMDNVSALATWEHIGDEPPPSKSLLEEDSVRLRNVLVAQPRFGTEFWTIYRRLRQIALASSEVNQDYASDVRLFNSTLHRLLKHRTLWLFLPLADKRAARLRRQVQQELQKSTPTARRI